MYLEMHAPHTGHTLQWCLRGLLNSFKLFVTTTIIMIPDAHHSRFVAIQGNEGILLTIDVFFLFSEHLQQTVVRAVNARESLV